MATLTGMAGYFTGMGGYFGPEYAAWCCADYGITSTDLASELGIAASNMERVMAGQDGMTFNQLRKVAGYFDRGALFFLENESVNETLAHTSQFRTLANQKPELTQSLKKLIERVEKQRTVYLSLLEELDEMGRLRFNPPKLSNKEPQEAARIVRKWLGLFDKNDFDKYRTAVEAQGILVFRSNGYSGKWQIPKQNPILGFTLYDMTCPVIVIKKQFAESRQSFTLMHELGHLLLHKASSIDDDQDFQSHQSVERDANAFAGHLLVPDNYLVIIQDAERPEEVTQYDAWLEKPRKEWGVSSEVILRRLLDAGRLTQRQYTEYRQWRDRKIELNDGGSRMYRYREPKHVFGDTFVLTVFDALNVGHITLAKASSYLDNLKINALHQLERYYAGF